MPPVARSSAEVLRHQQVAARAVRAEQRRQQAGGLVGGPGQAGQSVGLGPQVRHGLPDLVDQSGRWAPRRAGRGAPDDLVGVGELGRDGPELGDVQPPLPGSRRGQVGAQQGRERVPGEFVDGHRDLADRGEVVPGVRGVPPEPPARVGRWRRGPPPACSWSAARVRCARSVSPPTTWVLSSRASPAALSRWARACQPRKPTQPPPSSDERADDQAGEQGAAYSRPWYAVGIVRRRRCGRTLPITPYSRSGSGQK